MCGTSVDSASRYFHLHSELHLEFVCQILSSRFMIFCSGESRFSVLVPPSLSSPVLFLPLTLIPLYYLHAKSTFSKPSPFPSPFWTTRGETRPIYVPSELPQHTTFPSFYYLQLLWVPPPTQTYLPLAQRRGLPTRSICFTHLPLSTYNNPIRPFPKCASHEFPPSSILFLLDNPPSSRLSHLVGHALRPRLEIQWCLVFFFHISFGLRSSSTTWIR